MDKRKIALISEHASPLTASGGVDSGGQNIYVANVARQLARRGWLVDIFTRSDSPTQPTVVRWLSGIRVINVPAGPASPLPKEDMLPFMGDFSEFMADFFRKEEQPYDLIHANFFMSGWVGLQLKRVFGVPLVTTFHALGKVRRRHQGEADRFPDVRFCIENQLMRESDFIIAECPQDREDMVSMYEADPARIEIIPCGFDSNEFQPVDSKTARDHVGWAEGSFNILQLGRLVPRKGVDDVIRAVADLKHRYRIDAQLYVVGGNTPDPDPERTPEIGRLQALASELKVEDCVTFVGQRDRNQLRYYYSAADVFVTTPWYEPFGITPVEAMACGVPVVGSAVGGVQYSVADGETGLLVPPHSPNAIACALAELQANPARRRAMGQAALERANRLFTWSRIGRELIALYEEVIVNAPVAEPAAGVLEELAEGLVAPLLPPVLRAAM